MDFSGLPRQAIIVEVGPRDGLQIEPVILSTGDKAELIRLLAAAGLNQIQVTAFVNPRRVPQMADAESLLQRLADLDPDVTLSALALNLQGVQRACASRIHVVEVSLSASDTHGLKNAGMDFKQALAKVPAMIRTVHDSGRRVQASVQCAFGCVYEGPVPVGRVVAALEVMAAAGADSLTLADTTGMADPVLIAKTLEQALPVADNIPLALHLHDTRGLGLVNLLAALKMGVCRFDTAFGGLGGCPFVPGAAGNVATEDVVYLLSRLGVRTGIDVQKVARCSRRAARLLGRRPAGKLWSLLAPPD